MFRVLHSRLGEAVAAAVVLGSRGSVEEGELRQYVAARLVYYKVPHQILFVESIPRNEMGKVQRADMSQHFRRLLEKEFVAPVTEAEIALARIWSEVLRRSQVGRNDDFFALGGDSLLATRVMSRIRLEVGLELPILTIFENATLRELAKVIAAPPLTESGDQELAELIEEAERMTDEEIRKSLNGESGKD